MATVADMCHQAAAARLSAPHRLARRRAPAAAATRRRPRPRRHL